MQFDPLKRREFIALLGGAAVARPLAARAQQPAPKLRRIGVLMSQTADDPDALSRIAAFAQGLQELGWTVGRNMRMDTRWGAPCDDQIDIEPNQFPRKFWKPFCDAISRTVLDGEILAFDVPEFAQASEQGVQIGSVLGGGNRLKYSDAIDFSGLLRARRNRPHRRSAAEQADELPSPHVGHRGAPSLVPSPIIAGRNRRAQAVCRMWSLSAQDRWSLGRA